MTKQRLEKDFAQILKTTDDIWWMKIYHIAGAYTDVPGDFLMTNHNNFFLIECKECRNKSFVFSRLTQKYKLLDFEKCNRNKSFVVICFWEGSKKKSLYFVVPIIKMVRFMNSITKKSANVNDFKTHLSNYLYDYDTLIKGILRDDY